MRQYRGLKYRFITLGICVCGLVAFSTTLSASSTVLTLGSSASGMYYGSEYVGPYPGSLNPDTTDPLIVASAGPIFCLDANQTNYWGTSYDGTEETLGEVSQQDVEEAAFLASLMMFDAQHDGIDLSFSGSGGGLLLTQTAGTPTGVSDFVNNVEGPISYAIWQLMGTLGGTAPNPTLTEQYMTQAGSAYNKVLKNSSDPVVAAFNSQVMVFFPPTGSGTQRFVTAKLDLALIDEAAAPEPGTLVLFGTGVLLMALGCTRRLARRPR
jgi:hypothetical protein